MKNLILFILATIVLSCSPKKDKATKYSLTSIAEKYVRLGLFIGQYDSDFVDAYYGPDSLKYTGNKPDVFPKDNLLLRVDSLIAELQPIAEKGSDSDQVRAKWITQQLIAFGRRIKIYSGEYGTFDEESKDLFGVKAPAYPAEHYQLLIDSLDKILPGKGNIQERFQSLSNRFIIPKSKLDTVFKVTIAEARKRTLKHYKLPENETFTLGYVTDKPWSGYNWYKGNYKSEIQINTDLQIFIERAIDVGSHESYPGHHVYNMLLEKNLYNEKGWVEISLYPLFSPQSFIAEGSANYGVELAFPGSDKVQFAKEVILPLSGLDTTGISLYFKALAIKGGLNYARNEAARGLINNSMNEKQAIEWLKNYCLYNEETAVKSIGFIKKYRSYVINYNFGMDVVKEYVESEGADKKWDVFGHLISNPILTEELSTKKAEKPSIK